MNPLNGWAYNGDRLWTSVAGQHKDYGRVLSIPPHPKRGDLVETDTGHYRLGDPLMQESGGLGFLFVFALIIAVGLAIKLMSGA